MFRWIFAAGILIEHKNWPPLIHILHHDIANDIPAHLRSLMYWAYGSWLGIILQNEFRDWYCNCDMTLSVYSRCTKVW